MRRELIIQQISDSSLPVSRKAQREQVRENAKTASKQRAQAAAADTLNAPTKRKRNDLDESDPKLQEFLEVMQPASKSKTWSAPEPEEPPTKVQAIESPEAESDGEYEAVPKKSRKHSPPPPPPPISEQVVAIPLPIVDEPQEQPAIEPAAPNATDDDWLRSRTNRLLDLMEPEEIPTVQGNPVNTAPDINPEPMLVDAEQPASVEADIEMDVDEPAEVEDMPDPTMEAIKATGRLFVRNLPYTATEDDLRKHFAAHGALEEVCFQNLLIFPPAFVMNIQIGTAYATSM